MPPPTLAAYERWLRAQGYSTSTVRAKVDTVLRLAAAAGVPPHLLTVDHVVGYLADRQLAAWSRRKYLQHLSAWAAWAQLPDPAGELRRPPAPRGLPRPVGEDDLAALLEHTTGRTRAYVVLGAYAGLRSAETARVRGADLRLTPAGPVLRVAGKGGRVDDVPVSFVVQATLAPFRREHGDGRLWPGVSAGAVQKAVRRAGERLGIAVSSHQLRHRFGTALYAASHDLLRTQQLMRHASPVQTAGYAALEPHGGRELVNSLPTPGVRQVPVRSDGAAH